MTATFQSVMSAALQLAPGDRCLLASNLWDSTRSSQATADEEMEALLDQREAEMDENAESEISHEQFMSHFASRLRA
jgi:putative addiction module component (TIGR02574 family)